MSSGLHDELLRHIHNTNPEVIDFLLKTKLSDQQDSSSASQTESDNATTPTTPALAAPLARTETPVPLQESQPNSTVVLRNHNQNISTSSQRKMLHRQSVPAMSDASRLNGTIRRHSQSPYALTPQTASVRALQVRSTPERTDKGAVTSQAPVKTPNSLQVPSLFETKERASNSSLSSGYFGSSRSGTTSPTTPEVSKKWYMDSPPASPPSQPTHSRKSALELTRSFAPAPFHSLQRPLGVVPIINVSSTSALSTSRRRLSNQDVSQQLPCWNVERWRHWEEVARQRSEELQQQETLV